MPVRTLLRLASVYALAALAVACGDGTGPAEPAPVPGSLTALSTVAAAAAVGTDLVLPSLVVRDTKNRVLANAVVRFRVLEGGGAVAQDSARTDAQGTLSGAAWTLGPRPGPNRLEASVTGVPPVVFVVTAQVGEATSLVADSANAATGVAGQLLERAPGVRVQDRFGNGVPGVAVAFSAGAGSGTVTGVFATTSDAQGLARPGGWTLGTSAGPQTLVATAGALSATLAVTARAGAAASLQPGSAMVQNAVVGTAVSARPAVRVRDAHGNAVGGVSVTFAPASGGGTVAGSSATTGADGVATVSAWTLGTTAGVNTVVASLTGLPSLTFTAIGVAGPAATLEKVAGDSQRVTSRSVLPVRPAVGVRDAYGNPVVGLAVAFVASAGTVSGGLTNTDSAGIARVGSWTLGSEPGTQTLEARIGTLTATFTATALPGVPTTVELAAGNGQSAVAGTAVASRPAVRVRDAGGNPLAGVPVQFAVAAGGGVVSGAAAVTGADGVATVGGWTLGTSAGANTLTGTVAGVGAVTFNATGLVGPAARVEKAAGDGQTVAAGSVVPVRPSVRVTDTHGNAVGGSAVTFAVAAGGGAISGGSQVTGSTGIASVGSWAVGTTIGTNSLVATVSGVGSVTFTAYAANPAPSSQFDIDVRYVVPVSAEYQRVFADAVARWRSIIIGDLAPAQLTLTANACGASPALNETVDDVVIYVEIDSIDGPGQILGQAGPCYLRSSSLLPSLGMMRFDIADLDRMLASGTLGDVILHEIGHVLGIGTLWTYQSLLQGAGTADPFFSGVSGMSHFTLAGGSILPGNGVPVENTGSPGTRDGHWRESTLRNELMTGWVSSGGSNPLSAITIGSLADLGYTVNYLAADAFTVPAPYGYALVEPGLQLIELPPPTPRVLH